MLSGRNLVWPQRCDRPPQRSQISRPLTILEGTGVVQQKTPSVALGKAAFDKRLAEASPADRAATQSETLPVSSGFLTALSSKPLDLTFEPEEFVTELSTRPAAPVYQHFSFCPLCDNILDTNGFHASTYMCGGDKVATHNAERNRLGHYAETAGDSQPEPHS